MPLVQRIRQADEADAAAMRILRKQDQDRKVVPAPREPWMAIAQYLRLGQSERV